MIFGKKVMQILVCFCVVLPSLSAQCIDGNCYEGTGTLVYKSGSKYIGQFLGGERHGAGTLFSADGSRYQGAWHHDQMHGKGVEVLPDGSTIRGTWENGRLVKSGRASTEERARGPEQQTGCMSGNCLNGKGIFIFPTGAVYVGDFLDGEIHGYGTCYYANGSKYQGYWAHRYPEGNGTKTYHDGTQRTGFWKKGQPVDEFGNFVDEQTRSVMAEAAAVDLQTGCLMGDCFEGEGTYAYANGSRYEGLFRDGKPNDFGTFYYANGDRFEGYFDAGMPHGEGVLYKVNGKTLSGRWEAGEFQGRPNVATDQSFGCMDGNCNDGVGTYIFRNGSTYTGTFLDNRPHGAGKLVYANGGFYEGELKNGLFDGEGTLYLSNDSEVYGYWSKGTYMGEEPGSYANTSGIFKVQGANADVAVWALVVGIASYDHMPVLNYTDDDAYQMFAFFKSPEGGALDDAHLKILVDEDATKQNILQHMRKIFKQAGPNDLVILYFSGHGLPGSFLPIDFDGINNKLMHEEINAVIDSSSAKFKLCIADACHSGSLLTERGDLIPNTIETYYRSLAQSGPGSALLMSSKSNETSLESSGLRQGVFSHFLIKGLQGGADIDNNKIVTIQELYNFISHQVRTYTGNRQSPIIEGEFDRNMAISVCRQ